jgi:hypothetical protein
MSKKEGGNYNGWGIFFIAFGATSLIFGSATAGAILIAVGVYIYVEGKKKSKK